MMLPGMAAGWIHDRLATLSFFGTDGPQGYLNFFWWVMICCLATFAVTFAVKIDPAFGRKKLSNPDT
jgi:PAT family beta-lactamase induction signal transducer AmpG